MQDTNVTVIGAGPYGLSAAAFLLAAGIETRVFGEPMAFWRNRMPAGMFLVQLESLAYCRSRIEAVEISILGELSERFLRAMDYYGLVEVEYKLDPRDSQYELLDVNARTWGFHSLGATAGVNFAHMLYLDQIGQSVFVVQRPTGHRVGANDYRHSSSFCCLFRR